MRDVTIFNLHLSVGVRINFLFLYFFFIRERDRVKPVALDNTYHKTISTPASHLCLTVYLQNINRLSYRRSLLANITASNYTIPPHRLLLVCKLLTIFSLILKRIAESGRNIDVVVNTELIPSSAAAPHN